MSDGFKNCLILKKYKRTKNETKLTANIIILIMAEAVLVSKTPIRSSTCDFCIPKRILDVFLTIS